MDGGPAGNMPVPVIFGWFWSVEGGKRTTGLPASIVIAGCWGIIAWAGEARLAVDTSRAREDRRLNATLGE